MEEDMSGIGFDAVIGQEQAVSHLQNALHTGRLSQAYLIHGEKGAGKTALATALAAALMCEHPAEKGGRIEPCGVCHSCLQVRARSHPDVIWVDNERAGAVTKTATLGVSVARFIQSDVGIKPYQGDHKLYIVPNADTMSQQAQNALLKTLEEPPAYAVLMLLTDNPAAFLPTVLSRCVTIQLHPAPEKDLLRMLEEKGVTGPEALTAVRLSHGNPGRCRDLLQEDRKRFRQEVTELLRGLKEADSHRITVFAQGLAENKAYMDDFLDFGQSWYRDLLVMKSTETADSLIFREEIPYIRSVAMTLSYQGLQQSLDAFDEAQRRRRSKENEAQIAQLLLLKLRRILRSG